MVRAILEGRKTQTRRIMRRIPNRLEWITETAPGVEPYWRYFDGDCAGPLCGSQDNWGHRLCPYGLPGDQLWVREEHRIIAGGYGLNTVEYAADKATAECLIDNRELRLLRARKRPFAQTRARFMYRSFSRITLGITAVRVERLNDITEADAIAEGVSLKGGQGYDGWAKAEYMALWESLNGPGSWAANPWVWVIEFHRIATWDQPRTTEGAEKGGAK
jgi:hypothetical protein